MNVSYTFGFADGETRRIDVDLLRATRAPAPAATPPEWTRLSFRQCGNCPLQATGATHCPAAVDLAPAIAQFAEMISHQEAQVVVQTPERVVGRSCQVQQALSSLVALIMATSACPILGRMRGLALMHLPFATAEEGLFRVVGAYLVGQWLVSRQGGTPDWDLAGLKRHYAELEVLNKAFKKRVDAAAKQDAALNAVSALGVLSLGVGIAIDDQLAELSRFAVPAAGPS